jgi:hypothetical protein
MIREIFKYKLIRKIKLMDEMIDIIYRADSNKIKFVNENNFSFYINLDLEISVLLNVLETIEKYLENIKEELKKSDIYSDKYNKKNITIMFSLYKKKQSIYDCNINLTVFYYNDKVLSAKYCDTLNDNNFIKPLFYTYNLISTMKIMTLDSRRIKNEIDIMKKYAIDRIREIFNI